MITNSKFIILSIYYIYKLIVAGSRSTYADIYMSSLSSKNIAQLTIERKLSHGKDFANKGQQFRSKCSV